MAVGFRLRNVWITDHLTRLMNRGRIAAPVGEFSCQSDELRAVNT